MKQLEPPTIIVGGGIGGLAAALGLAQKGRRVVLLEKTAALSEIGAGIQLGPNAFHAFDFLGIGAEARTSAVFIDQLRLMDAQDGTVITHIDLGTPFRQRFRNPYAVVHRGDLHAALVAACRSRPEIELRTGCEVVGYAQDTETVTAQLQNGSQIRGIMLIGADGLWSNIRRQVVNDGPPRVSGHSTYRSVVPLDAMPEDLRWNAAALWAGPKCHIVHYPLSGWKYFNLVVTRDNAATTAVAGIPVARAEVLEAFSHLSEAALRILRVGTDWKCWVLCDREPVETWTDGRVALLGDAAHPMLQYFAQGACMALEDAVCLADIFSDTAIDPPAALKRYNARRRLRTARVQLQSRAIGEHIYHPSGAHAALRNQIMRAKTSADYYGHLEWLYGGNGLSGKHETTGNGS